MESNKLPQNVEAENKLFNMLKDLGWGITRLAASVILARLLSMQSQAHPDSRGGQLRLQLLMGEWQGHTVEEHMAQVRFLKPPLENAICHTIGVAVD